jgi:hypothetical protein
MALAIAHMAYAAVAHLICWTVIVRCKKIANLVVEI